MIQPVYGQVPVFLQYNEVKEQLVVWNKKYKDITKIGSFGNTSNGDKRVFIKLQGKNTTKKTVLIHASIHANECLSTSMCLGIIGKLLYDYNKNQNITDIVNSRDIFLVPILSVESYPKFREVDGVDPNRNFNASNPIPPVRDIKKFFNNIKPDAVVSCHTYGRLILIPYGNTMNKCRHDQEYRNIVEEMSNLCGYRVIRACQLYNHPIQGAELDAYYNGGAFSIVMEFGDNQQPNTWKEIKTEFIRTYPAFLYFLKYAPEVEI